MIRNSLKRNWPKFLKQPTVSLKAGLLLVVIIAYATTGFMFFEFEDKPEIQWLDALWWSIVTMTTVGFGDYFPVTTMGRILIGFPTMLVGMGLMGYALGQIVAFFLQAEKLNRKGCHVPTLSDHIIICNFSTKERLQKIVTEIRRQQTKPLCPIVLVADNLTELPVALSNLSLQFIHGLPSRRQVLERAHLKQATRVIVLAQNPNESSSDNLSVSICLTVRDCHPQVHLVAECVNPDNQEILQRAGCQNIICLSDLAPSFLAQALFKPGLQQFILGLAQSASKSSNEIQIVPLQITPDASLQMRDLRQWSENNRSVLIGLKRQSQILFNLKADQDIQPEDAVVLMSSLQHDYIRL